LISRAKALFRLYTLAHGGSDVLDDRKSQVFLDAIGKTPVGSSWHVWGISEDEKETSFEEHCKAAKKFELRKYGIVVDGINKKVGGAAVTPAAATPMASVPVTSAAFAAAVAAAVSQHRGIRPDRRTCYHCNQVGHIKPNCPVLKTQKGAAVGTLRQHVFCEYCGIAGHTEDVCNKKKKAMRNKEEKGDVNDPFAALAFGLMSTVTTGNPFAALADEDSVAASTATSLGRGKYSKSTRWVLDCAASHHMVTDKKVLRHLRRLNEPVMVTVLDGKQLMAQYEGTAYLRTANGVKRLNHTLLYEGSNLNVGLISLGTLDRQGAKAHIGGGIAIVRSPGGAIAFRGRLLRNNVYSIDAETIYESDDTVRRNASSFAFMNANAMLWHRRLAHLNMDAVKHMHDTGMVRGLADKNNKHCASNDCDICKKAKATMRPFGEQMKRTAAVRSFERVHMDLAGPFKSQGIGSYYYTMVLVDEATDFVWMYLLRKKSDAAASLILWHALVKNQFNALVKEMHSDYGGEFTSSDLLAYWAKHGVLATQTPRSTPQHNAIVERKIRTIKDAMRAWLIQARLPPRFWSLVLEAVVHVINRSARSAKRDITPYEALHAVKPFVDHFRVFGCDAYVMVRNLNGSVLERGQPMIFVGYNETRTCWRFYLPSRGVLVDERNASFDEEKFTVGRPDASAAVSVNGGDASYDGGEMIADEADSVTVAAPMQSAASASQPAPYSLGYIDDIVVKSENKDGEPVLALVDRRVHFADLNDAVRSDDEVDGDVHMHASAVHQAAAPGGDDEKKAPLPDAPVPALRQQRGRRAPVASAAPVAVVRAPSAPPQRTSARIAGDDLPEQKYDEDYWVKRMADDEQKRLERIFRKRSATAAAEADAARAAIVAPVASVAASPLALAATTATSLSPADALEAKMVALYADGTGAAPTHEELLALVRMQHRERQARETQNAVAMTAAAAATSATPSIVVYEPKNRKEAMASPQKAQWLAAEHEEMQSQRENNTYTLVPRASVPAGKRVLDSRFVYKPKLSLSGAVARYKVRLVVRGFMQEHGVDYFETFAPVMAYRTLRVLLSLAASLNLEIKQFDIVTAFLHAPVKEEIYMDLPDGYSVDDMVAKLHKAIYGIKQAPRAWNTLLNQVLVGLGFKRMRSDSCVYSHGHIILAVFVDDIIVLYPLQHESLWISLRDQLMTRFRTKDLGDAQIILGMRITRDRHHRSLFLDQESYVRRIVERFGGDKGRAVATPIDARIESITDASITKQPFRELIGSLLYAAVSTRPDIAYATCTLAQHCASATDAHYEAGLRVVRYLNGTAMLRLRLGGTSIRAMQYTDADWAGEKSSAKSMSGGVTLVGDGAVSWHSRKQSTVSLSSMESEYYALASGVQDALWIHQLLFELGKPIIGGVPLLVDNSAVIDYCKRGGDVHRSRHVNIKYHFVRDHVEKEHIHLQWVPSAEQLADIFTKPLERAPFEYLRALLLGTPAASVKIP